MARPIALASLAALCTFSLLAGCGREAAPPPPAQAPASAQYDANAFYGTTSYGLSSGFAWSPDDQQLLVHSDETGIFNAYSLSAGGKDKKPLTTSTVDSTFAVSWFPEDARILFTADKGGNEINHLYVRETNGETRDLTPGDAAKATFGGWAADRQSFFVLTTERDPKSFDVYRYSTKDYARTLVFTNADAWDVSAISPDGRYLALAKPRTSADSDLYLVDTRTKAKPKLITKHEGNINHGVYAFTRDGKHLVYSTDEHGEFTQAWTYELASGKKERLIAADWDVSFVAYSDSGRFRVSGTNEDARTVIRILDGQGNKEITLPGLPPGDRSQIRFSRDETRVALLLSSDTSPNDVYTVDLASGRSERLTQALNPQIKESDLVATQVVRYKSDDGVEIPSILYRPKAASTTNKVPALVWVHGGPGDKAARVIRRRSSTWSITAMPCSPRIIAARQAMGRRSSIWMTSAMAKSTSRTSCRAKPTFRRWIGSTRTALASSAVRTAATWWARRSPSNPTYSMWASIFSAS